MYETIRKEFLSEYDKRYQDIDELSEKALHDGVADQILKKEVGTAADYYEKFNLVGRDSKYKEDAKRYLIIKTKFLGTIPYDEKVHLSLINFSSYMTTYPNSEAAESIKKIAHKLALNNT